MIHSLHHVRNMGFSSRSFPVVGKDSLQCLSDKRQIKLILKKTEGAQCCSIPGELQTCLLSNFKQVEGDKVSEGDSEYGTQIIKEKKLRPQHFAKKHLLNKLFLIDIFRKPLQLGSLNFKM